MSDQTTTSNFPQSWQVLSGSILKLTAIIVMFIDHFALVILSRYPAANTALFSIGNYPYSLYRICRDIGRAAFPIFCFLLVEGFFHTRNRFRYARNLFLFACISEIPWNFMHTNTWTYSRQNVFFTLFLGVLAFWALESFHENQGMQLVCVLAVLAISLQLSADYGWKGYVFLLILYWLRKNRIAQAVLGSSWLYYEWKASFAFIFINLYNGKRGFIKGKFAKYFFYAFYPLHIVFLVILRNYLFS